MSEFLLQDLQILEKYFKIPNLIEICINKPHEVWLETFEGWQVKKDDKLSLRNLTDIAKSLATFRGQSFSEEIPLLSTSLPHPYNYRVQFVSGSLLESGIAISIRVAQSRTFSLDSYSFYSQHEKDAKDNKNLANISSLEKAVESGQTLLIVGGTCSGKTALLNSLIPYIPKHKRIIAIEDTKELIITQPNNVRLLKSKTGTDLAKIEYKDIINACMRLRPDILLLGELDIDNTVPFLRLLNTGHAGSMTTLHANSPEEAIKAISLNAKLSGLQNDEAILQYVRNAFNNILFIKKQGKKFNVSLDFVKGK